MELDNTPRYVPDKVMTVTGVRKVIRVTSFPPGTHPKSPIINTLTDVEVTTDNKQSRWYGVERCYINSELRFVVVGFNRRFEEISKWEVCKTI